MVEHADNYRVEELLARLAKLEVEVAQLTERCENDNRRLVERFETLERKVKQLAGHLSNLWSEFMDRRAIVSDWVADAFERIMNLELSVFPNLLSDMASVHKIIGYNAQISPLDSRKSFPRPEKQERDSA